MNAYRWLVLVISLLTVHVSPGVAQQTIHIRLAEAYFAQIDIGIGKAERSNGADTLRGTLTRQPDGTYTGRVVRRIAGSFAGEVPVLIASHHCGVHRFDGARVRVAEAHLEAAVDRCENVANIIESVIIKHT